MSEMKMEAGKKPSLLGLFTNPTEQFERLREKPIVAIPLIVFFLMALASVVLVLAVTDFGLGTEEAGEMAVDPQMAQIFSWIFGIIGGIVVFGSIFLVALIYWGLVKIAGSGVNYKQILSLTIFTSIISSIGSLINSLVVLFTDVDPTIVVTSLKSIIPAEEPVASILAPFEVFSIWSYILLAIGFQKVAGLSKKASWTITIIFFAIILIFSFLGGVFASFSQSFEGNV
ncbi:Yip1 family protein [Bacillus gobiensis]|uniref:Yip1 family protein n=1 Tax=Bacillus gobiensis TaxID=1441095 RepID=UPI003D1D9898